MAKFDLKSIYTSDKEYTVLQLIKSLIEAIDKSHYSVLYNHRVSIHNKVIYIVNNKPDKITTGLGICNALIDTYGCIRASYSYYLIHGCRPDLGNIYFFNTDNATNDVMTIDITANCNDIVTEI